MIVALLNQKGGAGKTTLALGGRIKIKAFRHGVTAADMLRDAFMHAFPDNDENAR
ncbi:hypothetical protein [Rhodophyticola sp.]|uniref:hypothetical protein n=1 Tax=Rhodophyticola sp. TaxID=2680032 RepID=UPI003D270691